MKKPWIIISILFLGLAACQQANEAKSTKKEQEKETKVPETLTLQKLDIASLSLPSNWQTAGAVSADLNGAMVFQIEEGNDFLVCRDKGEPFTTPFEHGDIEIEVDFMVPKGSNSGIYFQGRYELQILDSWKKETVGYGDLGGIYAHTIDEATGKDIGGIAPIVNAAKAPGLWQNFKVLFRAPKFDASGTKIENAKFEKVLLNDFLIHEEVEVEKPTIAHMLDGEAAMGPIMIQGDHGPVAFKNFRYKRMGTDTVAVSELEYALYKGHWDKIPNFEELTPDTTGKVANLHDLETLAGQKDKFAMIFTGEIEVPKDGDYLFTTIIDDGGELFINNQLLVHNVGEPGLGRERGLINLTKGKHALKLTFFEEVWLALAVIYVEGPEMPAKALASVDVTKLWGRGNKRTAKVAATEKPALVRGFVDFKGGKKTHALTVGDPSGIHYTYDLLDGALLKSWRGAFADVTNMWVGRGQSQTMLPENAAAEFSEGVPIAKLNRTDGAWPGFRSTDYKNRGYRLDADGRPIFLSSYKDINLEDQVLPSNNGGLKRAVKFTSSGSTSNHFFRLAKGGKIIKLANGMYSIDGNYYLQVEDGGQVKIRHSEVEDELVAEVADELKYELIW